jgi:UDP-N-acetylglucosamine:LPS N-acetylglucosamine transferase
MRSLTSVRGEQRTSRVELIYFDAGGGHRASAAALQTILAARYPTWQVELVNLRDRLEPLDFIRRLTGVRVETFYNGLLKANLTMSIGPMLTIMHALIRRMQPKMVPMLAWHWRRRPPDLVVSMIPHFNRAIFAALRAKDMQRRNGGPIPMATIMTDLADYPPHFWIERQEQFMLCGTARAAQQALAVGLPADLVLRTSGMIVRPEFYRQKFERSVELERADARRRLELDPERPTGLVMFGGYGSRRMEVIAKRLAEAGSYAQLIFVCGRNQLLRQRLHALELPFPHYITGFTENVAGFMRLADFFIGKPGPGSISEALVMGLPVIVERNAMTMVHERYNTDWILENRVGVVVKSFSEVDHAIAMILDSEQARLFRRKIASMDNRALFEIPSILEELMEPQTPFSPSAVQFGA